MRKRKYTLRKRAEAVGETRARIVEAAMAVHEELGPLHATVSAIAERAGVQRLTVYRHFPDEVALFHACTSGWLERHPPPDAPRASDVGADAGRRALEALYRYYRATQRMWTASYRDLSHVPALEEPMRAFERYLDGYRDALLACWRPAGAARAPVKATLTLAVRFSTWRTLDAQSLDERAMARLVDAWLKNLRALA